MFQYFLCARFRLVDSTVSSGRALVVLQLFLVSASLLNVVIILYSPPTSPPTPHYRIHHHHHHQHGVDPPVSRYKFSFSYVQIYQEEIFDVLCPDHDAKTPHALREDPNDGV